MARRILMLGPPGCGKGSYSKICAGHLGVSHLSTGDMFREAVESGSEIGKLAQSYMQCGKLVPDEISQQIVEDVLLEGGLSTFNFTSLNLMPVAADGFILDGYPRTVQQAEFLDCIASIDKVIHIRMREDILIRWTFKSKLCR